MGRTLVTAALAFSGLRAKERREGGEERFLDAKTGSAGGEEVEIAEFASQASGGGVIGRADGLYLAHFGPLARLVSQSSSGLLAPFRNGWSFLSARFQQEGVAERHGQ